MFIYFVNPSVNRVLFLNYLQLIIINRVCDLLEREVEGRSVYQREYENTVGGTTIPINADTV